MIAQPEEESERTWRVRPSALYELASGSQKVPHEPAPRRDAPLRFEADRLRPFQLEARVVTCVFARPIAEAHAVRIPAGPLLDEPEGTPEDDVDWFLGHPEEMEKYRGQNVAIFRHAVVGAGDPEECYDAALAAGAEVPLVVRVPTAEEEEGGELGV